MHRASILMYFQYNYFVFSVKGKKQTEKKTPPEF